MSFLAGFENDVFISYSHVDNLGDLWVQRFHEALEVSLTKRVGRMGVLKIWRDRRLEGNQLFDQTIKTSVQQSAVFLAMTSNGYLESDYCLQELKWFHDKAGAEPYSLQIGDRSRIYNVLLSSIPHQRWPTEYPRTIGYALHDAKDEEDLGKPTDPEFDKLRYSQQLSALTDSLFRMLLAFKERIEEKDRPSEAVTSPAQGGQKVFIADVADSLVSVRKRLVTELQRKGVSVEAAVPPPYEAAAHEQRVAAVTSETTLSIHLLDGLPGREIDGEPGRSYPQKQVELVREQKRSQLIWVPKALDITTIEDDGYKEFLNQLENGKRDGAEYDFIRGSGSTLTPQVLEKLEALKVPPVPENNQAILLDTHLKDQLYAFEIGRLLLENHIQPYINPQEDDPNKNLDTLEARLAQVSCLAIVYGNVNENWVRQRLGNALQLSVTKRLALKSFCVVLVPPEKPGLIEFGFGPVTVRLIDNSRSATVIPALLAPLFVPGQLGQAL